jgi:serine/threonine-protein kinase ULK/ATG1
MHVETRELVAIKKVSWEKLERKEPRLVQKHKQQLRNEIEAMKALTHVNVVRLLHHQNTPKYFIMVLEFCAGGDLANVIRLRREKLGETACAMPEMLALRLTQHLAAGLKEMRKVDWVHRDLKPGNLLLTCQDLQVATLKIADFGFAKSLKPLDLAETWVGSPLYMAPEVLFKESGGYV